MSVSSTFPVHDVLDILTHGCLHVFRVIGLFKRNPDSAL